MTTQPLAVAPAHLPAPRRLARFAVLVGLAASLAVSAVGLARPAHAVELPAVTQVIGR